MAQIIGLPRLSPTMEEGTIVRWVKREGEDVAKDDVIAEIETDKANMEWRAFEAGVLLKTLAAEGATLQPDAPVAIMGARGEDISELVKRASANAEAVGHSVVPAVAEAGARDDARDTRAGAPSDTGDVRDTEGQAPDDVRDTEAHASDDAEAVAAPEASRARPNSRRASDSARVVASPSVRRLARERGVDLTMLSGSGPGGRIVQRDLERLPQHSHGSAEPGSRIAAVSGRAAPRVVRMSATRRTIARRLVESKQTIPHYYLRMEVDARPLREVRHELNRALETEAEKISLNDLLICACARALRRSPEVNVSVTGDDLVYHQVVDISVAVAVPDGLVTPVVRDADSKGVLAIAREVRELATLARAKRLTPEQMANGTFTISNLGMFGIDEFAAVINPPQAAILAVGAVRDAPQNSEAASAARMYLTLSCDHRAIDGAVGAQWMSVLRSMVENPVRLLL